MTGADRSAVEVMLGRTPRGDGRVARRCHLGLPVVVEVPPVLPGGEPFPTLYWLTCPLAVRRVGRLEDAGLVKEMSDAIDVSAADADYAARRGAVLAAMVAAGTVPGDGPAPSGGVGGAHGGVKCLHGRYGFWLVGGDDPAGAETARRVGRLDCAAPCVEPRAVEIEIRRPRDAGPGIGPAAPFATAPDRGEVFPA